MLVLTVSPHTARFELYNNLKLELLTLNFRVSLALADVFDQSFQSNKANSRDFHNNNLSEELRIFTSLINLLNIL